MVPEFSSKNVVKNIFSLTTGRLISIIINLASIMIVARILGVEEFGFFSFLIALTSVISKIIEFGFSPIVFRELSKSKNDFSKLNTALSTVIISLLLLIVFTNIVLLIVSTTPKDLIVINVLLCNVIFSSKIANIRELLSLPFKSRISMTLPISLVVLDNILFIVLLIPVYFFELNTYYILYIYVISNIPGFIFLLKLLKKRYLYKFQFDLSDSYSLIKTSLPLYGFILITALYQQLDVFFLKFWFGEYEIGIISVANRYVVPLLIFPAAIIDSLLPIIVKNRDQNITNNNTIILFIVKLSYLIYFIIASIFTFKSNIITSIIWGPEFVASSSPAIILLWTQIFSSYNFIFLNIFVAYNFEKWNFGYAILLLCMCLFTMTLLIPEFSFMGAAFARLFTALSGTTYFVLCFKVLQGEIYLLSPRAIIWSLIMLGSLYLFSALPLTYYLLLAVMVTPVITIFINYFNMNELHFVLHVYPINKIFILNNKIKQFIDGIWK